MSVVFNLEPASASRGLVLGPTPEFLTQQVRGGVQKFAFRTRSQVKLVVLATL